jgi:hypothetical protein
MSLFCETGAGGMAMGAMGAISSLLRTDIIAGVVAAVVAGVVLTEVVVAMMDSELRYTEQKGTIGQQSAELNPAQVKDGRKPRVQESYDAPEDEEGLASIYARN